MATLSYGPRGMVQGSMALPDAIASADASASIDAEGIQHPAPDSIRGFAFALVILALLLLALLSEVAVVGGVTVAFNLVSKVYHQAIVERYEVQQTLSAADEEAATESVKDATAGRGTRAKRSRSSGDRPVQNAGVRQDRVALDCMANAHACN